MAVASRVVLTKVEKDEIVRLNGNGDIIWRRGIPRGAEPVGTPWTNALARLSDDMLIAAGTLATGDDSPGARGWLGGLRASGDFAGLPVLDRHPPERPPGGQEREEQR